MARRTKKQVAAQTSAAPTHFTTKALGNGYVQITPDTGYVLVNKLNGATYSEAVVKEKEVKEYEAQAKS